MRWALETTRSALEELKEEIRIARLLAKLPGLVPTPAEVTVVAGENKFDIKLGAEVD